MPHSNLQFGCEFEFYPRIMTEEELIDDLKNILKEGIELKRNLPNEFNFQ